MRRVLRTVLGTLFLPLRTFAMRLLIVASERHVVCGVEVRDLTGSSGTEALASIGQALHLLEETSTLRFRQLQRSLRRIVLTHATGTAYWPSLEACLIRVPTVERLQVAELMLLLVHEATHARLDLAGIRVSDKNRGRIERLCMRTEAEVAARLPDAHIHLSRIEHQLAEPWWTPSQRVERGLAELHALGCPEWFVRSLRWVLAKSTVGSDARAR